MIIENENFIVFQKPRPGFTVMDGEEFSLIMSTKMGGPCVPKNAFKVIDETAAFVQKEYNDKFTTDLFMWAFKPIKDMHYSIEDALLHKGTVLLAECMKITLSRLSINTNVRSPYRQTALLVRHPVYSTMTAIIGDDRVVDAYHAFTRLLPLYNKTSKPKDFKDLCDAFSQLLKILGTKYYMHLKTADVDDWGIVSQKKALTYRS